MVFNKMNVASLLRRAQSGVKKPILNGEVSVAFRPVSD
jgi:hypothetical protein